MCQCASRTLSVLSAAALPPHRGGVPVCFPQFGMMGPMPQQHGFARNTAFKVGEVTPSSVSMHLDYDGTSQAAYPHPFRVTVSVALAGDKLTQTVTVQNTGKYVGESAVMAWR